ncbi:hypothetical protein JCM10450v2_002340 [Rhodotorula kratochvilovae]
MHVFVTGASGFVGSAVVKELLSHGHTVLGLARNSASADKLKKLGADVHEGSVLDLESLKAGAAKADGVIHLAFQHDFSRWLESCREDGAAIEALGSALEGTDKPLVVTSGTAVLSATRDPASTAPSAEDDPAPTAFEQMPRIQSELSAQSLVARGVRVSVLRLPPTVHGPRDGGFVAAMVDTAHAKGAAAYVGEGANVWPAVHRDDAAAAFRLALEKAPAGAVLHAVGEEGVPLKSVAEVIGRKVGVPVKSVSHEEAGAHFGWLAHFAEMNAPASSDKTRKLLGWEPEHIGLLEDLETGTYFDPGAKCAFSM